jgi:hypothetical protein
MAGNSNISTAVIEGTWLDSPALRNDPDLSHHSGSRAFVAVFLLSMIGGYLLLLLVNVLGNAANLFPSPWRPALTERAWKTRRLDALLRAHTPPDVIILGSSRVMQIRPSYVAALTGSTTFNYGVSAAGPVDWYAQIHYLLSRGAKPKMIILGVDEFCFGSGNSPWQLQTFGHAALARNLPVRDFFQLLGGVLKNVTPQNTSGSFRAMYKSNKDNPLTFTNRSEYTLSDGYMIYKEETDIETIRASARAFLRKNAEGDTEATSLTPRRTAMFDGLLDFCHDQGIQVRVMLLPLQPEYARIIMSKPHLRKTWHEVAVYLAQTCPKHHATFNNFSNPKSFGGDPIEFWDGAHVTAENARRMMNALFDLPPFQLATAFPSDDDLMAAQFSPTQTGKKRPHAREKSSTTRPTAATH